MLLKLLQLRTVAVLVDRALEITDTVNENVIGAHLTQALHVTEQRISELENQER